MFVCPAFGAKTEPWGFVATCLQNSALYCTAATGALEMAGRAHSVPQERSKVLFDLLRMCRRALKGAARAPAWCPRALEVAVHASGRCPRALEVAAQASAQCPRSVRNAFSGSYSEPERRSSLLLRHRAFEETFKEAVRRRGARLPELCDTSLCCTPHRAWICTGSH